MKGGGIVAIVTLVISAIIVGLVLRFGKSSIPLAADATGIINTGFGALTLANPNTYPYYAPTENPVKG